jgi:hypothetical protein
VQVESLAQVGVQLLLFTLGLEFRWVQCPLISMCIPSRAGAATAGCGELIIFDGPNWAATSHSTHCQHTTWRF